MNITPETKVAELLAAYPQLEAKLIEFAPAFSALKKPALRRTVAKVTSLRQAAKIAGLSIVEMVDSLRAEAGLPPLVESVAEDGLPDETDDFVPPRITHTFDARPVIRSGESPKKDILKIAESMKEGDCLEILTDFPPVPIADLLRKRGMSVHISAPGNGLARTFVSK